MGCDGSTDHLRRDHDRGRLRAHARGRLDRDRPDPGDPRRRAVLGEQGGRSWRDARRSRARHTAAGAARPRRAGRPRSAVIELGYALSSEEHSPAELVRLARAAEQAGFTFALVSDHYHPWTDRQGESAFVWSVIGAIAQATDELRLGTGVT